mgnify:CR=1 FL=1
MNFELNNIHRDSNVVLSNNINAHSPVVEIFAAMANGESLDRFGKKADAAVNYIKGLGDRAQNGDYTAIAELNTIRRFAIESPVMEEIKLLSIFGSYQNVGFDESIEREITRYDGERSRIQAPNGDVVYPSIYVERYPVPTFTVSGGYAVDYRRVALGDMSKENEGLAQVKVDILNRAKAAIVKKVFDAIDNATGIKYMHEAAGLTKTGVDSVLNNVRRYGRPTIVGDYAVLAQFTPWAGYKGSIDSTTITGVSEKAMNDIAAAGMPALYNGAILAEIENPYNEYALNANGDNYATLLPAGLAFVLPAGGKSPIATWSKGGLTTLSGNDVHTGHIISRFDIEVACDVAKGREHEIGVLHDTNLDTL